METVLKNRKMLEQFLKKGIDKDLRIALVGIGNEARHDDFVGVYIIQQIQIKGLQKENILLVEARDAPTQFITQIYDWKPDCIIMIDAIDAQQPAGAVLAIPKDALHTHSVDSHSNAKILLLDFLLGLLPNLQVQVLGIQVKDISFAKQLSEEVQASAEWLIEFLYKLLDGEFSGCKER
jgi:hydrogenase maturation protease